MISIKNSSERLNQLLMEKRMTPTEFARAYDVPKSSISNYLNGKSMMRPKRAEALARKLNVNPEWLLGCNAPRSPLPEKTSCPSASSAEAARTGIVSAFSENAVSSEPVPSCRRDLISGLTPNDRAVIDAYLKAPENIQKAIRTLLNLS